MKRPIALLLAAATMTVFLGSVRGQRPEEATASQPRQVQIVTPQANVDRHEIVLPAAFWNEQLTSWVEVAATGRPSDFLHETIVSITTTRKKMEEALRSAGFHDADAWVQSVADFPRVRGDRALILLEVTTKDGKTETFSLDELLAFEGWNVSIGPFGWMFKGDPERAASTGPAAQPERPLTANEQILRDDPQVALQFKGLQHLSQSYMDHPLCYDDWIYPNFRYNRNTRLAPKNLAVTPLDAEAQKQLAAAVASFLNDGKTTAEEVQRRLQDAGASDAVKVETQRDGRKQTVDVQALARHLRLHRFWMSLYDSNGSVPVRMIIRKVSDTELLSQSADLWHDAAAAAFIREQLPVARQIDQDKAALWGLLPALKKRLEEARTTDAGSMDFRDTDEFAQVSLLAASLEKGYATLDDAWTRWSCDHTQFDEIDQQEAAELTAQAKLWREHMSLQRQRAEALLTAEEASVEQRRLRKQPAEAARDAALRRANGMEIAARSQALRCGNTQAAEYWRYEQDRLTPDDPRQEWRRHIEVQVALVQSKLAQADAGIAFGKALQAGDDAAIRAAQLPYQRATLQAGLAGLEAQAANVEFEISKREGLEGDTQLPDLIQRRDALRQQIKEIQGALQAFPATSPATTRAPKP